MLLQKIILLIVLLIFSAFFSGVETAMFTLSRLKLKHLVKKKVPRAKDVEALRANPRKLLITVLIGNNIVNIGASALATSIAYEFSLNYAVGITTGVMTFLILVFGEITPKSIATKHNEAISLAVARPVHYIQLILFPLVFFFEKLTSVLTRGNDAERPLVTEEEIKSYVSVGQETGQILESEREMIHRIFEFDDLEAMDVMTPRSNMVCVSADMKIKIAERAFHIEGHSRLPVYDKDLDNIVGFVHIMDVHKLTLAKKEKPISTVMREILFVPSSKKLDTLLRFFQRKKQHMAIVVDEFGTNIGLITIENVLEEIVGEIIDETEKVEPMMRRLPNNKFLVRGRSDIEEVNQFCNLDLKEDDASNTLSSHILQTIGRIPTQGERLEFPSCRMELINIHKNTINTVLLTCKRKKKSEKGSSSK
ncbi:MAG: hemolysin family protein [Candidatus Woesearchaeota archaeon]